MIGKLLYTETIKMPSVIFETKATKFSIPSTYVQAIIKLPQVTLLPNSPENIRGVIRYREELYNIIDFRKALSINSISEESEEFISMINQREKDHINWLVELENSVDENREFKLTTDPRKCAFGKWYDKYTTDNYVIKEVLNKFDMPHKKIHSIAIEIERLKSEKLFKDAKTLIAKTRDKELSRMKLLFHKFKEQIEISNQELTILFNKEEKRFGIAVDKINSVEEINNVDTKNLDSDLFEFADKNFINGLGEDKNKELIISISDDLIY